jgi:hypothetical protein
MGCVSRCDGREGRKTGGLAIATVIWKRLLGSRRAEMQFKYSEQLPRAGMARLARRGPRMDATRGRFGGTGCQKSSQIPWHSRFPVPPEHPIPLDTGCTYMYSNGALPTLHHRTPLDAISALPVCGLATHLRDTAHQVCRCPDGFPLVEFPICVRVSTCDDTAHAQVSCNLDVVMCLLCYMPLFLLCWHLSRFCRVLKLYTIAHRDGEWENWHCRSGQLQGPRSQRRGRCRDFSLERGLCSARRCHAMT